MMGLGARLGIIVGAGASMIRADRACTAMPRPPLSGLFLLATLLMSLASSVPAAEIRAWLSSSTTPRDRPVELVLEIHGEAVGASDRPDLSVLDADFHIVDRRTSRSISVVNGRRHEQYHLSLALLPMRVGEIGIPPIQLGDQSTAALNLTVTEPVASGAIDPAPYGMAPVDFQAMPFLKPLDGTPTTPVAEDQGPIHREGAPIPQGRALDQDQLGVPDQAPEAAPLEPSPPGHGVAAMIFGLALVAVASLILLQRSRQLSPTASNPSSPAGGGHETLEDDGPHKPMDEALARVRTTYASGNPSAARDALLDWARLHWPDEPPGNLAQLVLRCPEPVRTQIAALEKAFYSPSPIPWQQEPVWEGLASLS